MTEQEITQAREDLAQLDIEQLRCGVMLQLLKIEALTKERDALAAAGERAVAALETALITLGSTHAAFGSYEAAWDKYADAIAALKKAGVQ